MYTIIVHVTIQCPHMVPSIRSYLNLTIMTKQTQNVLQKMHVKLCLVVCVAAEAILANLNDLFLLLILAYLKNSGGMV